MAGIPWDHGIPSTVPLCRATDVQLLPKIMLQPAKDREAVASHLCVTVSVVMVACQGSISTGMMQRHTTFLVHFQSLTLNEFLLDDTSLNMVLVMARKNIPLGSDPVIVSGMHDSRQNKTWNTRGTCANFSKCLYLRFIFL